MQTWAASPCSSCLGVKGWHICIPVAGISRGLWYLCVLQPLGGIPRGQAGTLPCTAHDPAGWTGLSSCSCWGQEECPPSFVVNLCLYEVIYLIHLQYHES